MKAKKIWLILGGLLLGLVALGAAFLGPDYLELVSAARSLDAELERAKRVGNPLKASDFVAPKPPDSQNATIEFEQSRNLVSKLDFDKRFEAFQTAVLTEDFVTAGQLSKELQPLVTLAEKVASKPVLLSGRNVDSLNDLGFAFASHAKNLVRLLCVQAQLDYHLKNFEEGNARLKAGVAIGSLISQDRFYLSLLIESSCRAFVFSTIEKLAILNRTETEVLEKLDQAVPPLPPLDLYSALRGEAYFGTVPMRNIDKLGGWKTFVTAIERSNELVDDDADPYQDLIDSVDPKTFRKEGVPERTGEKAFFSRHLAFWNDVLEKAKQTKDPVELSGWMGNKRAELDRQTGPSYRLVKSLVRTFEGIGQASTNAQGIEWGRRGLVKVLLYRARFGRYPKTLAEAGFNQLDPYTQKPFRMLVNGETVKVYSVGPNGVDDQGAKKLPLDSAEPAPDDVGGDTERKNGYPIL